MPVCISNEDLERMIEEDDNIIRKAALKELVRARVKLATLNKIIKNNDPDTFVLAVEGLLEMNSNKENCNQCGHDVFHYLDGNFMTRNIKAQDVEAWRKNWKGADWFSMPPLLNCCRCGERKM